MVNRFNRLDFRQVGEIMEDVLIDTDEVKYTLLVGAGVYSSDSFIGLLWEILKHRTWHLFEHGKWID